MIHCIGDSHVLGFLGDVPASATGHGYGSAGNGDVLPDILDPNGKSPINLPFRVHWLGARLAWALFRRRRVIDEVLRRYWQDGDRLMFVAGELDCRGEIASSPIEKHAIASGITYDESAQACAKQYMDLILSYRDRNPIVYWGVPSNVPGGGTQPVSHLFNAALQQLAESAGLPFLSFEEELLWQDEKRNWYDGVLCDTAHIKPALVYFFAIKKLRAMGAVV